MTPLRVLTVDDEPLALRRLQLVLADMPDIAHVGSAKGRTEALRLIAERQADVVLLDIKLRDGTGFDVIDRLADDRLPAIIFVTAFDDYAARAFDVSAIDYVLKPVGFERLRRALDKARAELATRDADQRIAELRDVVGKLRDAARAEKPRRYEAEFWVRRNVTDFVRVPVDTVEWISAEDDYVCLHADGRRHLLRETIRGALGRLDPARFVRVHRSALVGVGSIAEVRRSTLGTLEVVTARGDRIKVGRVYAKALRRALG